MGCEEIGEQVRRAGAAVHVFGHSHMNSDADIAGTRFLQCALGYPNERWMGTPQPKRVWPPKRR